MRRVLAAAATLAVLSAWPAAAVGPTRYRMSIIGCTDQRSGLVGANAARSRIVLWNLGYQTVLIAGEEVGSAGHVGGTIGWPLHSTGNAQPMQSHALALLGGGQIECIVPNTTQPATAHVGVLEEY